MISEREPLAGLGPRHPAARAVAAALKALLVTEPAHDERSRTHAARDDAELALARADSALARDEDGLAEVPFARHVVVMAVHRLDIRVERFVDDRAQRADHGVHHHFAVDARKVLRPLHGLDVIVKVRRALR